MSADAPGVRAIVRVFPLDVDDGHVCVPVAAPGDVENVASRAHGQAASGHGDVLGGQFGSDQGVDGQHAVVEDGGGTDIDAVGRGSQRIRLGDPGTMARTVRVATSMMDTASSP